MTDIDELIEHFQSYLAARKPASGCADHIHAINGATLTETDLREAITALRKLSDERGRLRNDLALLVGAIETKADAEYLTEIVNQSRATLTPKG